MTDKVQSVITALKTYLASAGYTYADQYSIDAVNRIGNNTPTVLILPQSIVGEVQPGVNECVMTVDLLVYIKATYNRMPQLTIEFNKIKTALFDSGMLGGVICGIPNFSVNYGTDGISSDMSTAGTAGQLTIGTITFDLIYYETR